MSALRYAIDQVGGVAECARICGISPRGVYKWLHRESLPRTEYTGETQHAQRMAAASGGAFTAEWLLDNTGPGSASQSSPDTASQLPPESRERIYRSGDNPEARRADLIAKTIELALMADERGREAREDPSAARDQANYRVTYHTLSAELLALTDPNDAEEAKIQRENRQEHLKHADYWQRRLVELGGAA